MTTPQPISTPQSELIPATLRHPRALHFWLAVVLTGVGTGIGAAALMKLLQLVQRLVWGGSGTDILQAAQAAGPWRHIFVLVGAGLVTGVGQLLLKHLPRGSGSDVTAAIWFHGGRIPALRTLGNAILSVIGVGMGVSLGREGAPKEAGAVFANLLSDKQRLSDEQRRLLVACGAGAGMSAAYGVPLGGALFAMEVMRGKLALRYVLPALFTSLIATGVSWLVLPNAPTYIIPAYGSSGVSRAVDIAGGSDRWCGGCRLHPHGELGGSSSTAGVGTADSTADRDGIARSCINLVPTNSRQRPGYFGTGLYESGGPGVAGNTAGVETNRNGTVHAKRRTRRHVYSLVDIWRNAGGCAGLRVVALLAGNSVGTFCGARSQCGHRSNNAGTNFSGRADDGTDRQR